MMERRGCYRKGSAGHARSTNLYRLFRQRDHHDKKWRWPVTAVLALVLVFGVAPSVGEEFNFQASVLTADEVANLEQADNEQVKKALLDHVKSFVNECGEFKMSECAASGNDLISALVGSDDSKSLIGDIENFENRFANTLAVNACKYKLRNAVSQLNLAAKLVDAFAENYGSDFDSDELDGNVANLAKVTSGLDGFVKSCAQR